MEPRVPARSWQFVGDFQQLVGSDSEPDARFFVDSWTFGTAAAVENLQQRQQHQAQARHAGRGITTQAFVEQREIYAEYVPSDRFSAIAADSSTSDPQQFPEEPSAQTHEQTPQDCYRFAAEWGSRPEVTHSMTQDRAYLLLGVTETSTQRQIKAAYRQMVSQWHPDRLELRTEEVRQLATERMAAINEAYRLLRSDLPPKSA